MPMNTWTISDILLREGRVKIYPQQERDIDELIDLIIEFEQVKDLGKVYIEGNLLTPAYIDYSVPIAVKLLTLERKLGVSESNSWIGYMQRCAFGDDWKNILKNYD